jgi:hypothetical protein
MSGGFVKLYQSITRSSVWGESHETRLVWITMLVEANADGIVEASVGGLAHLARVTKAECEAALAVLSAPDEDSRSPEHEGRRIRKVDGGWLVLNHAKYRARQSKRNAQAAERMRRYRERKRNERNVTRNAANVAAGSHQKAEADADADLVTRPVTQPDGPETYLADLEAARLTVMGEHEGRAREHVYAARLSIRTDDHRRNFAEAVRGVGYERLRKVMVHRWGLVARGELEPALAACTFHGPGGFRAALDAAADSDVKRAIAERAAREAALSKKRADEFVKQCEEPPPDLQLVIPEHLKVDPHQAPPKRRRNANRKG